MPPCRGRITLLGRSVSGWSRSSSNSPPDAASTTTLPWWASGGRDSCMPLLARPTGAPFYTASFAGRASRNSSAESLARGNDVVLHGVYARRAPGSLCGFLSSGPGAHAPRERHLAAIGANLDVLGLDFGVAIERPLDRHLDIGGGRSRLDADQVENSGYAGQVAHGLHGRTPLVLPIHFTAQTDQALLDGDLDVARHPHIGLERARSGVGDFLVAAFVL